MPKTRRITIFYRPTAATSPNDLQKGTSVGHKQFRIEKGESPVQKKKKAAFEKRERTMVRMASMLYRYIYSYYVASCYIYS